MPRTKKTMKSSSAEKKAQPKPKYERRKLKKKAAKENAEVGSGPKITDKAELSMAKKRKKK